MYHKHNIITINSMWILTLDVAGYLIINFKL
jgi:hypothetical protein